MISSASAQIEASRYPFVHGHNLFFKKNLSRWRSLENNRLEGRCARRCARLCQSRIEFFFSCSLSYLPNQVQGLLIGCVAAFVIFITVIGPEYV